MGSKCPCGPKCSCGPECECHANHTGLLTARLDQIASDLEKYDPKLALIIDQVSDRLEKKASNVGEPEIKKAIENFLKSIELLVGQDKIKDIKTKATQLADEVRRAPIFTA